MYIYILFSKKKVYDGSENTQNDRKRLQDIGE